MAQLLYEQKADINRVDQDGSAPVHSAAYSGHVHIMRYLAQIGVDLETRGTVYIGNEWKQVLRDATPLMIARHHGHTAIIEFLQQPPMETPPSLSSSGKRIRSDVPIAERAKKVGVAHRLKAIPPSLHQAIQLGSEEEKVAARKALQKLQIANQQIVSRAESAQLKQAKLAFGQNGPQ